MVFQTRRKKSRLELPIDRELLNAALLQMEEEGRFSPWISDGYLEGMLELPVEPPADVKLRFLSGFRMRLQQPENHQHGPFGKSLNEVKKHGH